MAQGRREEIAAAAAVQAARKRRHNLEDVGGINGRSSGQWADGFRASAPANTPESSHKFHSVAVGGAGAPLRSYSK